MSKFRSRSEVEQILSDFAQSGQSRGEFCRSRDIKLGTFQWWLKRSRDNTSNNHHSKSGTFIRLTPQQPPAPHKSIQESELIIDFHSGARLKWRGTEVPSSVCQLITTLNTGAGVEG